MQLKALAPNWSPGNGTQILIGRTQSTAEISRQTRSLPAAFWVVLTLLVLCQMMTLRLREVDLLKVTALGSDTKPTASQSSALPKRVWINYLSDRVAQHFACSVWFDSPIHPMSQFTGERVLRLQRSSSGIRSQTCSFCYTRCPSAKTGKRTWSQVSVLGGECDDSEKVTGQPPGSQF